MAALPSIALETALFVARVAAPTLLVFLVLSLLPLRRVQGSEPSPITNVVVQVLTPRRSLILTLLSIATLSYLADGTVVVLRAVLGRTWEGSDPTWKGIEVADVLGALSFGSLIITATWKDAQGIDIWGRRRLRFFAVAAVIAEIVHVTLLALNVKVWQGYNGPHIPELPPPGIILAPFLHLSLSALRLLVLLPLYPTLSHPVQTYTAASAVEAPSTSRIDGTSNGLRVPASETSLLTPKPSHSRYGTFLPPPSTSASTLSITPPPTEAGVHVKPTPKRETPEEQSWSQVIQRISKLAPYLWPRSDIKLQFLASLCMIILLVGRLVNFLSPLTLKALVARFDSESTEKGTPWGTLMFYVFLRFLQGSGGLSALRDLLWTPVMQYSDREMSQMSFEHLLQLSLAFHTRKKTGEVLRILDRGSAINHIVELLAFNIVPTILDITIALGAFFYYFGPVLSSVVFVVMATYVAASIILTRWRTKLRRAMNDRDIITRGIHTDCLLNYETVKYFGGEAHESRRYREAILEYQALEWKVVASLNLLNFIQNFIISTGLLVGSLIVAWRVVYASSLASEFVFFITYLAQLYGPLNTLGYIYRSINQNLIDTERLLDLLHEPTEVKDKPDAPDLVITKGVITFENVNFTYDTRTTALQNVSFTVPQGHSVALVGESGSGKSTILRLLFRQYDLKEGQGRILIDGQDIREVTQSSLRKAIGIVPQDSVLFNAGIGYNIGYGKFGATQEEIEDAARAAQLHDRIASFPDAYDTKVGERGVRLSGGEKQRVSIARTFLKNAPILAMDEATSALDTTTEKDIQKALQNLAHGRSSISIAHRLSTIVSADIILVLKDGQIAESGSYRELVAQGGLFASMWAEQVSGDDSVGFGASPPSGDVKGYDLIDFASGPQQQIDPSHVLAPTLVDDPQPHPFLAPGPALVNLPATEAELKAKAAEDEKESKADQVSANIPSASEPTVQTSTKASVKGSIAPSGKDTAPSARNTTAPSVKDTTAPSVKDTTAPSVKDTTSPSVKDTKAASVKESVVPSVKESQVEDLASVKNLSIAPTPAKGTTELPGPSGPTYAQVASDERTEDAPPSAPSAPGPIAFPSGTPVSFPSSDDSSSIHHRIMSTDSVPSTSPGVTFKGTDSPVRAGTPEVSDPSKRKRISSQNFQRLARRISIGRRPSAAPTPARQDSKDESSVKEGSVKGAEGEGSDSKKDKKKDKKDKKEKKKEKTGKE